MSLVTLQITIFWTFWGFRILYFLKWKDWIKWILFLRPKKYKVDFLAFSYRTATSQKYDDLAGWVIFFKLQFINTVACLSLLNVIKNHISLTSVRHEITENKDHVTYWRETHWLCKLAHMNLMRLFIADITLIDSTQFYLTAVTTINSHVVEFFFTLLVTRMIVCFIVSSLGCIFFYFLGLYW